MHQTERHRLTSWKEIGAHLGRDVRTVLRWEKDRGLPIYRVPGATRRVVFAYTDELDTWAQGELPKGSEPVLESQVLQSPAPPAQARPRVRRQGARAIGAAAGLLAALGFVAWRVAASKASDRPPTVRVAATAIVATSTDGMERWRHPFGPGETAVGVAGQDHPGEIVDAHDVLTAVSFITRSNDAVVRGGELLRFSMDGAVKSTFTFEDRPHFVSGPYGPPWAMTDYRVQGSGASLRVAVAAHHYEWWPSVVTVVDQTWKRRGTFVNAGWVERMHWVTPDRLVIAGFSNALDGGLIALLDANALDGQSPAPRGSAFDCTSCGPGGPLRYIVMPRSEVNRVTGSQFNRVVLIVKRDALVARTIEVPISSTGAAADALYEFTTSLDLVRASYSDRYWEVHRELEAAGKITHAREQCPERNGPREIRVWEPESGWARVPTGSSAAPSSQARTRR
jgi:hypothetical protein